MLDQQPNAGRVGLVTITGDSNFGNRLQNYAMQRITSELGFSCSTILNTPRAAAKAPCASFFLKAVETRRCGARNSVLGQNFAEI